jgi:hypothetical protein
VRPVDGVPLVSWCTTIDLRRDEASVDRQRHAGHQPRYVTDEKHHRGGDVGCLDKGDGSRLLATAGQAQSHNAGVRDNDIKLGEIGYSSIYSGLLVT